MAKIVPRKYKPGQFNPVIQKKIGEHLRRCYEMEVRPDYPLPSLLRALMDELAFNDRTLNPS